MMNSVQIVAPMTQYERWALILSAVAILIPIVQWVWKKWVETPILKYYPNGTIRLFFNQSGSYIRINGVFESLRKPTSVKKVDAQIKRKRDNKERNLSWSYFISPFVHVMGPNAVQGNETAHPFRVDADSIVCAFIEFADPFNSFGKAFNVVTKDLFQSIYDIKGKTDDFQAALKEYQQRDDYKKAKELLNNEFIWEIGKYDLVIEASHTIRKETYSFEFTLDEADYSAMHQNIDEALVSPLKDAYGVARYFQSVDIELKNK